MRKEVFLASLIFGGTIAADCLGGNSFYIALLSFVPLIYAYRKGKRAPLFPLILGLAFVIHSFSYPWTSASILKLGIFWPGIFALFALHSTPDSVEMERNVGIAWLMVSMISVGFLYFMPAMISVIASPVMLALIGLMAGLALAYLAWK